MDIRGNAPLVIVLGEDNRIFIRTIGCARHHQFERGMFPQLRQEFGGLGSVSAAIQLLAKIMGLIAHNGEPPRMLAGKTLVNGWLGAERLIAGDVAESAQTINAFILAMDKRAHRAGLEVRPHPFPVEFKL